MVLTKEILDRYVKGQLEVQNIKEPCLFRGEIRSIALEESLTVVFEWLAEAKDYPSAPSGWVKQDRSSYQINPAIFTVSDIGPSPDGGDTRICLQSAILGEVVVFFPPNGSKLDRARVAGLNLKVTFTN